MDQDNWIKFATEIFSGSELTEMLEVTPYGVFVMQIDPPKHNWLHEGF